MMDCLLVTLLSSSAFAPLMFARPSLLLALVTALLFVLRFCVLYFVYVVLFEGFRGRTLGKAVPGLEVIREEDGGVPGPGRAALRALTVLFVDMFVDIFLRSPRP